MKFPKVSRKNLMFTLSAVILIGFLFLLKTSYTEGFQVPAAPSTPYLDKFSIVGTTITVTKDELVKAAGGENKQLVDVKVYALNSTKSDFNIEVPRKNSSNIEQVLGTGNQMRLEFSKGVKTGPIIQYADAADSATTKLPLALSDERLSDGLKLLNTTAGNISVRNAANSANTQLLNRHSRNGYSTSFLTSSSSSFPIQAGKSKNILVRFIFN